MRATPCRQRAREILDEGDRRIFDRTRASLRDGWVLAVFSVPESERQKRHMLRSRLTWLGFGTVGPGVWIAPGHLEDETRDVLVRQGLADYVDLFHADYLGFGMVEGEAANWWDLDSLDALYREFLRHLPAGARGVEGATQPGRRGRGLRRLRARADRLAPAALPRPGPGARAAATQVVGGDRG